MKELNCSRVKFDSNTHTYEVDGKSLEGVTPIISWVFRDTYEGIPTFILKQAADHGSAVHEACEMSDSVGIFPEEYCAEVDAYNNLKDEAGLKTLTNEYLVDLYDSNYLNIASSIDVVFKADEDGCYPLADIKTTSQLHIPNITLQLSIYAMMFESMNKGKKAGKLYTIWLPKPKYGKPALVEVKRIPSEKIWDILKEYREGGDADACAQIVYQYVDITPAQNSGGLPADVLKIENSIVLMEAYQQEIDARMKALRALLLKKMQAVNEKKWEGEHIIITRKEATTRKSLDSAKVKSLYPDIYENCLKESNVSESITIKVK